MSSLEDQLELAVSYVESGQYEEGLEKIKQILNKADESLQYEIAQLYLEWGISEEAYNILKELHNFHPGHSGYAIALAEAAVDLDLEDEAIDCLTQIHQLDENFLSAQVMLADLYQSQGLEEAAERRLLEARKLAPDEPVLTYALGEFYASTGKVSEAIELYKKVLHVERLRHENIQLKLAEVLSLRGQFEEALIYYQKGTEEGVSLDGLLGYAVTAMQAGKPQTAITQLERLKDMDPQYSSLYPLLADAYEEEGALDEAVETLREGLKHDEHNERLHIKLAKTLIKAGQSTKAIDPLKNILIMDSEHVEALKLLVEIYRELDDYEAVIEMVNHFEGLDDPEVTWYYANALKEADELEKAYPIYESIAPHYTSEPDFLREFGELAWEMGYRQVAIQTIQNAYDLTQDQDLLDFLDRLREEQDLI